MPATAQDQQALTDQYKSEIEPELKTATKSEDALMGAISSYNSWLKAVQVGGYEDDMLEVDYGQDLIGVAIDNAIMAASADCVTNRDPGEAGNILVLYSLAQGYGITLENDGELNARYNTCAHFCMTFHSVITTSLKKQQITSTVSGTVFLVPPEINGSIGMWEGDREVLNFISIKTTTKARAKNCKRTWSGENSRLEIPGATINIPPSKYLSDEAAANPPKPTASLILTVHRVNEFLHMKCKDRKGKTVLNRTTIIVNFEMFRSLHKVRWQGSPGLIKFDHDAGWESLGNPYLSLGSTRNMTIDRARVSEETLIEIFHMPQPYDN